MHLVLADNAIARSKARANTAPQLRTCFYVGAHYEFYQCEGLNPTTFSYIVGDVTIELADFGAAELGLEKRTDEKGQSAGAGRPEGGKSGGQTSEEQREVHCGETSLNHQATAPGSAGEPPKNP